MSDEEKPTETPKAEEETDAAGEEEAPKEEESTATFEPVVVLEEVDVVSGEEEEEVVFKQRAKLFVFGETMLDTGTGNKTWKERGVGDVRLLRHRDHGRIRILMRREKTMKIIVNHPVDPRIMMEPNVGSDRSWVWVAYDFSENELIETTFAIRFADTEIAQEFYDKFVEAQREMEVLLAGEDGADEDGAADEAAEALSALKTSDDEAKADDAKADE